MYKTFPNSVNDIDKHMKSVATRVFGNRFMPDQTLYEYLIEFLLVFASAKSSDLHTGKLKFHELTDSRLSYWIEPRMGLRRFIFFNKTKTNDVTPIDEVAYKELIKILRKRIDTDNEADKKAIIDAMQDLLHGYAVVIRKRNWCAQTLLPVCPEMIFCDAMPNGKVRKKLTWDQDGESVDNSFDFDKRNFLARGGEVYYLHILQALGSDQEKRHRLESLLGLLLRADGGKLSAICNFIEESWESELGFDKNKLAKHMSLSYIPENAYKEAGEYSVSELTNYLSNELPPITKIEILAKGIMFQIMRMLSWRVYNYLDKEKHAWIVDMKGKSARTVRLIASECYTEIENDFVKALNKSAKEIGIPADEYKNYMRKINSARKSSLDIFRLKGKEIQCIIPSNGKYERFSLSEDVLRFLVLALIPPTGKVTLDMFLAKLYEHYKIVIGPEEYKRYVAENGSLESTLANSFSENLESFQSFLKSTGFLRELSDATSIVVNPYNKIEEA